MGYTPLTIMWLWWSFTIFLLLRLGSVSSFYSYTNYANSLYTGSSYRIINDLDRHSLRLKREEQFTFTSPEPLSVTLTTTKARPQTLEQLKTPQCEDSLNDCTYGGKCVSGPDGLRSCLCPTSCPGLIPVSCRSGKHDNYCLVMSDEYRQKYLLPDPACHMGVCVCPPMFDPTKMVIQDTKINLLPSKCDRREIKVLGAAYPSDSVYLGSDAILFCCLNVDPRTLVDDDGLDFIQNSSIIREPTGNPYEYLFTEGYDPPRCWTLEIRNAQFTDSGSYMCHVKALGRHEMLVNSTIEFVVKAKHSRRLLVKHIRRRRTTATKVATILPKTTPALTTTQESPSKSNETWLFKVENSKTHRTIQNISVKANATHATVGWEEQEGPMLKIDIMFVFIISQNEKLSAIDLFSTLERLLRRTDGVEVWSMKNAKSGIIIGDLLPATPYTLFINVYDGKAMLNITEHFTTAESAPEPPTLGEIRVLNLRDGLKCEVEWTPPKIPNGRITKYYLTVRGSVRYVSSGGVLTADDLPTSERDRCANYNGDENSFTAADAIADFYSCRFGPLKPNRNYTATLWAVNSAGRSKAVSFSESCITNYAQPDRVDPPSSKSNNSTSFVLSFSEEPDETNGPVACYYLAIVPILANVAVDELPTPDSIIVDDFVKTLDNNLNQDFANKNGLKIVNRRYFAYIAESYLQFPRETIIGDGNTTAGVGPCNVLYLSRHKPEDPALTPGYKYTGFMIVRVDRDESSRGLHGKNDSFRLKRRAQRKYMKRNRWVSYRDESELKGLERSLRQLIVSGPAYGFSNYFKPVILKSFDEFVEHYTSSWMTLLFTILSILFFILLVSSVAAYFMHKRGLLKQLCPISKERSLLKPQFHAVPVEDLPSEFVIRHRDSNFLFISEFEALPHYHRAYEAASSERRENAHKNRYNDIKSFDSTRVRLTPIAEDPSSDYINANFIKGYKGRKTFIATQGPVDASIDDFWRMVWEHKVRVVVMVANLYERSRCQCSKYWPDDESKVFHKLEVRPIESTFYSDYAIRKFDLRRINSVANGSVGGQPAVVTYSSADNGSFVDPTSVIVNISRPLSVRGSKDSMLNADYANIAGSSNRTSRSSLRMNENIVETDFGGNPDSRRVVQYHFTSWNDLQAPECTTGLLRFLHKLRSLDEYNDSLVVVHCSAGVGRTGTFIAIDNLLDQCIEEGKADVFGCVSEMRKQRNLMVQNYEQYVFIYKALAEWYMYGETDVSLSSFAARYRELKEVQHDRNLPHSSPLNGINFVSKATAVLRSTKISHTNEASEKQLTGIEAEYKRLENSLEVNRSCEFAHKAENANKNRYDNAVPFDQCRVVLSIVMGSLTDTTYINASFMKGYFYPYILAQDPIDEQTCYDFWRMVADQNSKVIVMLSNETEFAAKEKYWPSEVGQSICFNRPGDISVKLISEEALLTYTLRKLTYKFAKEKTYREVVQFGYLCWPQGSIIPHSTDSIIDLISRVLSLQSDHQEAGPIILHSRDGSSETGVFCCISLLLERLKAEGRIDVFQTVRSLQQIRPLLFKKLEQYSFCYQAVMDYLNSFSDKRN